MAAGKLLNLHFVRAFWQVLIQIIDQRRAVELFAQPNRRGIGFKRHECQCDL